MKMDKKFSLKEARKAKHSIVRKNQNPTPVAEAAVKPGPIIEGKPCPPPRMVDVLRVTKVFQECRIVDTNEVIDVPVVVPVGAVDIECLGAELIAPPTCVLDPEDSTATVTFSFATAYVFLDDEGDPIGDIQVIETLDETRTVFLNRADEPGFDCIAEVFLECLTCFISDTGPLGQIVEVTCCVGKQILVKLVADVQLLIPTLGYAPIPPECEQVAGECPDFVPVWPPYPPQSPDFPPTAGATGCGCNKKKS